MPLPSRGLRCGNVVIDFFSDNDFVTQNGFFNFGETTYKDASGLDYTLQSLVFLVEF